MKNFTLALLCTVALFQGCSKSTPEAPDKVASLSDAKSPEAVKQAVLAQKAADAPHADKAIPLTQYQELSSGKQLMFSYLAVSTMPVNYEKIASSISPEFQRENDEFKKRDILNALKPGIDKEMVKAKSGQYYFMRLSDNLDKYDFSSKSFGNQAFSDGDSFRYFNDNSEYKLKFANSAAFNKVNVPDEQLARTIETLRTQYQGVRIVVYFFVNDTELGSTNVKAEITKVQVTDGKGNVLTEI